MQLENNNLSVFSLCFHLILVVKYRRNVIDATINLRLRGIFEKIAENYNITVLEWNDDKDHIHILFKAHRNTKLSIFINAYKSASSRLIKKEFPSIRRKLWKDFWSRSFCLLTTGGVTIDGLKKYIESQGELT